MPLVILRKAGNNLRGRGSSMQDNHDHAGNLLTHEAIAVVENVSVSLNPGAWRNEG